MYRNIKTLISTLLMLTLFTTAMGAQERGVCGTEDQHLIIERLQQNREEFKHRTLQRTNMPSYVPVIYHLVADNNGNERVNMRDLLDMHCFLNEFYDSLNIQFYISELNYMDNSNVHTDPRNPNSGVRMRLAKKNTAMNIFVVKTIGSSQSGGGITLGYYTPSDDYIVVQQNQVNGFSSTLAHEVGHFFTLAHTFYGWEATTYDPNQPTPRTVNLGGITVNVEYVDRNRNCNNAADNFCDTPPDYLLGFQNPAGGCNPYTGAAKDPDNVPVDPQENNLMSYFERCLFYILTPEQQNAIQQDFQSIRRSFLRRGWTPPSTTVSENVNYRTPGNLENLPVYVNIELNWDDVPGATKYLVEIDRVNTFNREVQTFITEESQLIVPELRQNFNYYWRVSPYNDYYTCATGPFQRFRTGDQVTGVKNISGLESWEILPNPVSGGLVHLAITNSESIDGTISLIDIQGKTLLQNQIDLVPGSHRIPAELNGIQPGIYLIRMESNQAVSTKRIIIQP